MVDLLLKFNLQVGLAQRPELRSKNRQSFTSCVVGESCRREKVRFKALGVGGGFSCCWPGFWFDSANRTKTHFSLSVRENKFKIPKADPDEVKRPDDPRGQRTGNVWHHQTLQLYKAGLTKWPQTERLEMQKNQNENKEELKDPFSLNADSASL